MSKKQFKIKRYSSPMGNNHKKRRITKRVIGFTLALVVLLGVGYFGAPFVFDNIGKLWQGFKENQPQTPEPTPTASPTIDDGTSSEIDTPDPGIATPKTLVYCEVLPTELLTKDAVLAKAIELKAKGVMTAVITLKNPAGNIFFGSATDLGKGAKGTVTLDLVMIADTFKEQGIISCANLYTFMDKTTPTLDRTIAVKYIGTDYTWLDSAKELGGKPWSNPASTVMQNYIYSLSEEILSAGFKEIIYSGTQLPTGYSLDKREFGATNDQLLAQIKGFINTLQTKVSAFGARASFSFDFASVNSGDYTKYLEPPVRLGAENIILTCQFSELSQVDIDAFADKIKGEESIDNLSIWLLDATFENPSTSLSGYFVK